VFARVVKSVDTRDLKSLARKGVPVQVRPRAPSQQHNAGIVKNDLTYQTGCCM
jgi:hypothetical protein